MAMPSAVVTGMLPTLGLDKFKAYGGAAELGADGYDNITRSVICIDTPPTGVLNVFQFPATIEGPPEWVPASAHYYLGLHWDLQTAYSAVGKLTDAYMGPGSFEKLVQQTAEREPMLNPKTDIIDRLTGVVNVYVTNPGESPEDFEGIVALGVSDEEAVTKVIEKLLEQISDEDYRTEEVEGTTVYLPPNEEGMGAVAVADGQLDEAAVAHGAPDVDPRAVLHAVDARRAVGELERGGVGRDPVEAERAVGAGHGAGPVSATVTSTPERSTVWPSRSTTAPWIEAPGESNPPAHAANSARPAPPTIPPGSRPNNRSRQPFKDKTG